MQLPFFYLVSFVQCQKRFKRHRLEKVLLSGRITRLVASTSTFFPSIFVSHTCQEIENVFFVFFHIFPIQTSANFLRKCSVQYMGHFLEMIVICFWFYRISETSSKFEFLFCWRKVNVISRINQSFHFFEKIIFQSHSKKELFYSASDKFWIQKRSVAWKRMKSLVNEVANGTNQNWYFHTFVEAKLLYE